jgi:hypothetical protein
MRYLPLLSLIFFSYACAPDDDSPIIVENSVIVSFEGEPCFEQFNNALSIIEQNVNSASELVYNVTLFATGKKSENEGQELRFTSSFSGVSNPAVLLPGNNEFRIERSGANCFGGLFIRSEDSTLNINTNDGKATGMVEGIFLSTFGGCPSTVSIEFTDIQVID